MRIYVQQRIMSMMSPLLETSINQLQKVISMCRAIKLNFLCITLWCVQGSSENSCRVVNRPALFAQSVHTQKISLSEALNIVCRETPTYAVARHENKRNRTVHQLLPYTAQNTNCFLLKKDTDLIIITSLR